MDELIRINNLNIDLTRDGHTISLCRNLSFSIRKGETVGILGESGSGKSLTALSIPGLLPSSVSISDGEILFKPNEVIDLRKCSLKEIQAIRGKHIGFIFQEPMTSLNPVFTCGEQITEVLYQHTEAKSKEVYQQVIELFKKVKLPDPHRIFKCYPHQLSGGQRQRVMIAMAIACKPKLLIADEPTTALDVTVQKAVLDLLKELQQAMGLAILFITHDISVLAYIAQNVLVFNKGEIVEQGSITSILQNASHPYTKHLIHCRHERGQTLNEGKPEADHPLLSVRNLDVSFRLSSGLFSSHKTKKIVTDVSFTLFRGQTLGLVGESGSGKTTIGRALMQLIPIENGTILLNNIDQTALTGKQLQQYRRKIQIIFQDPYSSLNPKMTIGESLCEPLQVHGMLRSASKRRERAYELLELVKLSPDHFHRYPHQFSGGQRQRVGIARSLALEPEILILDESVSALDVSIQAQILSLLNDLKSQLGLTFIFISHDLEVVHRMSDSLIVLEHGNIVEQGETKAIFAHPQHPYTQRLLQSVLNA